MHRFEGHDPAGVGVCAVAPSADGKLLAVAGWQGSPGGSRLPVVKDSEPDVGSLTFRREPAQQRPAMKRHNGMGGLLQGAQRSEPPLSTLHGILMVGEGRCSRFRTRCAGSRGCSRPSQRRPDV